MVPAWYPRGCLVTGALLIVLRDSGPVFYAKWRDSTGRQVKRRLGPAWVERAGSGWQPRRGRVRGVWLDERSAFVAMAEAISAHERELASAPAGEATFADAVARWMHHLEFVKGVKPSTLADYRYPLFEITPAEVGRYLATLDADPAVGARTVNKHRQVLCCVFEHAMREDTFELPSNPARRTDKRREPDPKPIDFYEPEEVLALVRAARAGQHRDPSRPAVSVEEHAERDRCDEQDAGLFVVAAFTGLRMGELLALRWRNVDFPAARLVVEASWSAGQLTSPKSRKFRSVPLADQPAGVLAQLALRERFTGRDDLVFCSAVGDYLDGSALRRRYRRTRPPPACARCDSMTYATRSAASSSRVRPRVRQGIHGPRQDHDDGALPPRAAAARRRGADDQGVRRERRRDAGAGARAVSGSSVRPFVADRVRRGSARVETSYGRARGLVAACAATRKRRLGRA